MNAKPQTAAPGAVEGDEARLALRDEVVGQVLELGPLGLTPGLRKLFWGLGILGLFAIATGWIVGQPAWSWSALLVATLVVAGVAQVGVIWSAVFEITNARWGRSFRRFLELSLAAAPVALAALVMLMATSAWWAPFAGQHFEGGKGVWLSLPFWAVRNVAGVLLLFVLSFVYLYHCLRPDLGLAASLGKAYPGRLAAWLARGFGEPEVEIAHAARKRAVLAPILCIVYAVVYSMVGFDLVMAMDIWWYSTLFGAYHFIGNVYLGLAVAILMAVFLRTRLKQRRFFSPKHFGIIGSCLFAFCFLMGDFFWSQFLTIYYGDLPEETPYLVMRTMDEAYPYHHLAWAVLIGFFAIPFIALIFRAIKWVPSRLAVIAGVVLLAMIAERFLTAAPPLLQLEEGSGLADLLPPLLLTFLASFGLLALGGLLAGKLAESVPLLPIGDPLLVDSLKDDEERP